MHQARGSRKGQRFSMTHASRETRFAAVKAALRVSEARWLGVGRRCVESNFRFPVPIMFLVFKSRRQAAGLVFACTKHRCFCCIEPSSLRAGTHHQARCTLRLLRLFSNGSSLYLLFAGCRFAETTPNDFLLGATALSHQLLLCTRSTTYL